MTQAGNTTQTMKPKEVNGTNAIELNPVTVQGNAFWAQEVPTDTASSDVNTLSDILAEIPYVNEEASLRGRVIDLEERLGAIEDRLASFNVRSGQKV